MPRIVLSASIPVEHVQLEVCRAAVGIDEEACARLILILPQFNTKFMAGRSHFFWVAILASHASILFLCLWLIGKLSWMAGTWSGWVNLFDRSNWLGELLLVACAAAVMIDRYIPGLRWDSDIEEVTKRVHDLGLEWVLVLDEPPWPTPSRGRYWRIPQVLFCESRTKRNSSE